MARIRTIKPEFWKNEALSELPEATHMLAAALLNYADDDGYFNANPRLVQAECFPLREPSVSIQCSLTELSNAGYLRLGTGEDGRRYGYIVNFSTHQYISRKTESKIKNLQIVWEDSVSAHGVLSEPSPLEGNREQGKEQGTGKGIIVAPNGAHRPNGRRSSSDLFDEFWSCWDIQGAKRGKADAQRRYSAALKGGVEHDTLCSGARAYMAWARRNRVELGFIKHPATWLNKGCWADELPDRNQQESKDEWADRLARETADEFGWGSH